MAAVVKGVSRGSPAYRKIKAGDSLVSINGNSIRDVLDYKYYSYDKSVTVHLETAGGKSKLVKITKPEGEELGLEFESYLMDSARSCANKCVFCFVDQLPEGMRDTLYFKDDDARLSFLTGNYVTLTNLSEREIRRITDLKISPINISVHTTDPLLRQAMLGNKNAGRCMELMGRFRDAKITMNCQIVCCPGLNDGDELRRSMADLAPLFPYVNSVSIVPVGLTKYRAGLCELRPFDKEPAAKTLDMVENFADSCFERYGSRIFFASDEMYLKAGRSLPPHGYYEGYPQLENGVGMLRLFMTEFEDAFRHIRPAGPTQPFSIATGVSAAPFMEKLMQTAAKKCDTMSPKVYSIINTFFGDTIDVAGLITGGDLITQLRGRDLGKRLLIPQNMLRQTEDVFLDDVTLDMVRDALGIPIRVVMQDGHDLAAAIFEK